MALFTGERAKFLTVIDNQMADEMQPLYTIDVMLTKASKTGIKCGAITVFRMNMVDLKFPEKYDFTKADPKFLAEMERAKREASQQSEEMYRDPTLFKETEGRWVSWALDKAISLYDELNGCARITLKCPKLRIEQRRSAKQVAALRSNMRELFPVAYDIDRLLSGEFSYDPWSRQIRRGSIGADRVKK